MDRILQMFMRQIVNMIVRKGAVAAMQAGGKALRARLERKTAKVNTIDQDVSGRRKLNSDEREGDDVLYPTDEYTEDMQPRR